MRTSCIIALVAAAGFRDLPACFEFMGAVQPYPRNAKRAAGEAFPLLRVYLSREEEPLSPNPARVTRDLYESRYSSVIARARSLRRYISGVKKKYVRICRRRDGGGFFLAMEVGKRTLRLDPLSGSSSAERSVRLAIRIF